MGLCASTNADRTDSKYQAGKGNESKDNGVKRKASEGSISNVTETKIETALAAAKARRLVISDVGFEVDPSFVCPKFDKTSAQTKIISDALEMNFFMYKELESDNQTGLVDAMQPYTKNKNDKLMRQGDDGDQMYVVESGTFDIIVNGNVVKSSGAKDVIGELALIYQVSLYLKYMMMTITIVIEIIDRNVAQQLLRVADLRVLVFVFIIICFIQISLWPLTRFSLLSPDFYFYFYFSTNCRLLVLHLLCALQPLLLCGVWIAKYSVT
jgi:hypothetical protein